MSDKNSNYLKYLKYKQKYLELKKIQFGGADTGATVGTVKPSSDMNFKIISQSVYDKILHHYNMFYDKQLYEFGIKNPLCAKDPGYPSTCDPAIYNVKNNLSINVLHNAVYRNYNFEKFIILAPQFAGKNYFLEKYNRTDILDIDSEHSIFTSFNDEDGFTIDGKHYWEFKGKNDGIYEGIIRKIADLSIHVIKTSDKKIFFQNLDIINEDIFNKIHENNIGIIYCIPTKTRMELNYASRDGAMMVKGKAILDELNNIFHYINDFIRNSLIYGIPVVREFEHIDAEIKRLKSIH